MLARVLRLALSTLVSALSITACSIPVEVVPESASSGARGPRAFLQIRQNGQPTLVITAPLPTPRGASVPRH